MPLLVGGTLRSDTLEPCVIRAILVVRDHSNCFWPFAEKYLDDTSGFTADKLRTAYRIMGINDRHYLMSRGEIAYLLEQKTGRYVIIAAGRIEQEGLSSATTLTDACRWFYTAPETSAD